MNATARSQDDEQHVMTEAHTPTPWFVAPGRDNEHDVLSGDIFGSIVTEYEEWYLARIWDGIYFNGAANAAFIVRAVNAHDDLVKALNRALSLLLHDGDPASLVTIEDTDETDVIEAYEAISAALAKARGAA